MSQQHTIQILKAGLVVTSLALSGFVDLKTGYEISLFPLYALPIVLAVWFFGMWPGVAIAGTSALIWVWADVAAGHAYSNPWIFYVNAGARLTYFLLVVFAFRYALKNLRLSRAQDRSLAVCSSCGKIRDRDGYWQDLDENLQLAGDPIVRAKLCADCARKAYAAEDPPASYS